jgi:hypothetical protein
MVLAGNVDSFYLGNDAALQAGPVRLAVDFSYQTPLSRGQDEGDLVAVLNGRVGARYRVSDTVALGGGVFSDRSPRERPRQFGEVRLHYCGATLAADISNRYVVREQDGDKTEEPASMAFGTTVALTYAVGRGEMVRGAIGGPELYREALGDVTAHEVMLHVGSTLMR